MPDYASDQFHQFGTYEKGKTLGRTGVDNPNFNYPSRFANPININNTKSEREVQRGFIRGIYPAVLGNKRNISTGASQVKQRRLFFQFNPTTLDRTVSMNMAMLNPLLQDPSNLLQPVPGNSSFSFDMIFNRESEVVTGTYTSANGARRDSSTLSGSLLDYGANTRPDDVSTLGVLADLYVLDSIIGQSITPDMVGFLKSYWNNASSLSQSSFSSEQGGASFSFNDTAFQTTVEKNYGNTAFLSPLPIRIVFSSLFMVEGFVELSSVQFIKFTREYVPTICKVTLSVRALYIGFARERAYLTDALETAVSDAVETQKKDAALASKMNSLIKYGTYFNYVPVVDVAGTTPTSISFVANYDDYSTTVIQNNLLPEPGLVSVDSEYSTFKDWYNSNTKWYRVKYGGRLTSSVSRAMKDAVEKDNVTWTYEASFEIVANKGRVLGRPEHTLLKAPINFKKNNGGEHPNGATDVANNANSKVAGSVNNDQWFIAPTIAEDYTIENGDVITFSIIHNYTLNYNTTGGGSASVTYSYRSDFDLKARSEEDWNKVKNAGIRWRMYEIER